MSEWFKDNPPNKGRSGHKHWFSPFPQHFGPYGDQTIHYHPCIEDNCDRILVADDRECRGKAEPLRRKWLGFQLP